MPRTASRRAAGFTLLELAIAVGVIGLLAAVAIPSYNDHLRRGAVPEAFNLLSEYRLKMEQYFDDNRNYGSTAGGACADGTNPPWASFAPANRRYFDFACVASGTAAPGPNAYTITATGRAGTVVAGHVYTITETNEQATTRFKGSVVAKACWLVKGIEC